MTINRLSIKNFVLVAELDIDLTTGFTVLTGETGAGKSILLDAIQLVLGDRASSDCIREGCQQAEIVAEFALTPVITAWLKENGCCSDDELFIKRQIDLQGKSRAWINGSPVSVQQLKQLAPQLVNIHGQHAWQNLLQPASIRKILDTFGKIQLAPLQQLWQQWQQARQQLAAATQQQENITAKLELLEWQIGEINKLNPQPDEWPELQAQHSKQSHVNDILQACAKALSALDGENNPYSSLSQINSAIKDLQQQQDNEAAFVDLVAILNHSNQLIQDVTRSLNLYLTSNEPDPLRLAELDNRLNLWLALARRFQLQPDELAAARQSWQSELEQLANGTTLEQLRQVCQQLEQQWHACAQQISQQRHHAAIAFGQQISALFNQLGMPGGRLAVKLNPIEPNINGLEQVEFLVAAHAGSTPKPIQKIASGGELSRLALAISTASIEASEADCLIFDEIDAGIGGEVANMVGVLMQQLGQHKQVLCVTHLAQVAGRAQQQFLVSKSVCNNQPSSSISLLDDQQRIHEIARMLSGDAKSNVALSHAKQILQGTLL